MRKTILTAMAASLMMTAFAGDKVETAQPASSQFTGKTVLVAYFSATGTTAKVAKSLSEAATATLFEIKPAKAYTSGDLDWHNKQSRSSVEMNDEKSRPAIANKVTNMSQYKVIYLGFPIWWGKAPRIINSFIEQYNLKGVTVIPFATSGSSDIAGASQLLQKTYSSQATWKAGRLLNGNPSVTDLQNWIKTIK